MCASCIGRWILYHWVTREAPLNLYVYICLQIWLLFSHQVLSDSISQSLSKFMSSELVYHPTISSSVALFSFCLQSFLFSGSFPMNQLCGSGGQSIEASASASVLPKNIQDWFPLRLMNLISLFSKGLSIVFSSTTVQKASILQHSFIVRVSHLYMTTGKTIGLIIWTFVSKMISLLF